MSLRLALMTSVLVAAPCAALAAPATNGKFVNTDAINGKFVNGKFVNGKFVNAATLGMDAAGAPTATMPGHYLYDPHVDGTGLAGWAWDYAASTWVWRTGDWFAGAELTGQLADADGRNPEPVRLRIDAVYQVPGGDSMLLHQVSVESRDDRGNVDWMPLCGADDHGAHVPAILLRGTWSSAEYSSLGGDQLSDSPYQATFACVTGALGKCAASCSDREACAQNGVPVALGYKRWAPAEWAYTYGMGFAYRDYAMDHQACTRMVRADYCGDGHSWTENGTEIDVYDKTWLNTASVTQGGLWSYEATWNEDGAVRIACDRIAAGPVTCGPPPDLAFPWQYESPTSYACYGSDGMDDAEARLGNFRRQAIAPPTRWEPIRF